MTRTRLIRWIRGLSDGPRPPPGRTALPVRIVDEPAAARTVLEAAGEATLWASRTVDALHLPRLGAVIAGDGGMQRASVAEALQYDPALTGFPYFRRRAGALTFTPPDEPPTLAAATVWLPFHATYNYGHFILDALPSLLAAEELGLLAALPPIAPPLKPWQRALLALACGPDLRLRETADHVVRLGEAVHFSSLDNFLHAPTPILDRLRTRMLARAPAASGARRVYLSRRGWSMRVMLNEAEVEVALRARGFAIVHPETLTVPEQVALMRGAEVVVGPTGAGLANAFFAPPEARVVEIQPETFGGAWVRLFRQATGGDASVFLCPAPAPVSEVPLRARLRLGFRFAYRVPLERFLAHVDARL